ncbi:MAG TPA: 16S rRNA (adenine(1518)-N(6)/adenine(1519)-N(6))-dimethyltransferase RsmA [bacterium]|nr:16S rRNA (adenine(1518)-N(6)/adenine(1519)-N(6))-dimethyltransferase RsmA [bacterium]
MPEHPKAILRKHGLEAKKSLGQNFLVPGAAERIARAARVRAGDVVVEIGPGLGALTEALLDLGAEVVAVDLDERMLAILREELAGREKLTLLHGDARDFDLAGIAARAGRPVKLVGNLPYYVSSPILRRAVAERAHLESATFTLQKEVADRIAAPPGSKTYGALSVLIGLYADASVALKLPPGAFHPPPGVDSAVLHLQFLKSPRAEVADYAWFEKVVYACFSHRRKTVLNSMKDSDLDLPAETLTKALAAAGIDPMRRAESMSVEEFARLAAALRVPATAA